MHLGYVGLGKMGQAMVMRLLEKGHSVTVFDVDKKAVQKMARKKGVTVAKSLKELAEDLKAPRTIWIMVPYENVQGIISQLSPNLKARDTIIDGGNSFYQDSISRARKLSKRKINFLDVGVGGGPESTRKGACLMVGGPKSQYKRYAKLFADLSCKGGYGHVGESGAGHFVKMVHNGIEYGMMQAMAEGFAVMKAATYYSIDLKQVAGIYKNGSVIESHLMGCLENAYEEFGNDLTKVSGRADETGGGRWTVKEAHKLGVFDRVIHTALNARKKSQTRPSYEAQIIMALRSQFGGFDVKKK
ncbi:MAG: phosphogluconate dehydrogenase (NAD(+)-dependent, decarboxylating) [Patescibacteria group bacterium]|nr:decarboxylating 6-phosphogluconate dehydrogenase [Patescibacteria group bacterium]MBU2509114.1 decarboxylating 6-phosphogluconate dehydrogenase [Patescibacteria group bacterium]